MPPHALTVTGAVLVSAAAACAMGAWQLANAVERFDARAAEWRARVSLLVEQHDAHVTALEAVRLAAGDAVFRQVADEIVLAYPRILSIDTTADAAASGLAGGDGNYRLANLSEAGMTLLTIDANALLPAGTESFAASIALPDGTVLAGRPIEDPAFRSALDSQTQPLVLSASPALGPDVIFPVLPTALAIASALVTYALAISLYRQWRLAEQAQRRALQGEHLARLEHASRVNALGEMAAGIAHEITQPLTAIMGQAQAGRRLLDRGDLVATRAVLDETVMQSKRASAILDRLRNWIRFEEHAETVVPLQLAIDNVVSLLSSELLKRGVRVEQTTSAPQLAVRADAVQLEQVLFNLVRNAIEAAPMDAGVVTIGQRTEQGHAIVDIRDNGPGMPDSVRAQLFEPFVTDKENGLGLGLALCQRLVERMGGTIDLVNERPTTFRVRLPMAKGGQT